LLAAFLTIVGLLIAIGAVSLAELDRVNQRAEDLVKLQRKIAAYRQIQHDTTAQLYSVTSALLVPDDRKLDATLRQLSQFGYDLDRLQFVAQDEVETRARRPRSFSACLGRRAGCAGVGRAAIRSGARAARRDASSGLR
jgi:CHASE3 domain sensor protein